MELEAERSPMGHLTWLASLEDDDFDAARMLADMARATKPAAEAGPWTTGSKGRRKSGTGEIEESGERPVQRRRRANSVIDVSSARRSGPQKERKTWRRGAAGAGAGGGGGELTKGMARAALNTPRGEEEEGDVRSRRRPSVSTTVVEVQLSMDARGSLINPHTYKGDPYWQADGRECGNVGLYPPSERRRRIDRFLEKRRSRVWSKSVKYDVRKNFADSRIRVKGRFVKKEEQEFMLEALGVQQGEGEGAEGGEGGEGSEGTGSEGSTPNPA
jgi:hypothetical protein